MIRELVEAVHAKRVSARELVGLAIERIERHDSGLNAVVALRPEEALAEASAVDERIAGGEDVGPLVGIPFLVKDIEDLAGTPTTAGSLLWRGAPPAEADGLIPARLRAAGAVPVGKANTPEFASEGFTANRLFGETRNPWAPDFSPGGSSGGSGAAVAAGMVPIGTATDTGGSIRIPAAFCGLVGLKPTNGLIGRDPKLWWPDLTTCGPLGVSVDDVRLLLQVQAGPVAGDPTALPTPPAFPPSSTMPPRIVAARRNHPWGPIDPDVEQAFTDALGRLERDLGVPVEQVDPAKLHPSGNPDTDWPLLCAPELVAFLGRDVVEGSLDLFHPSTRSFLEFGLTQTMEAYIDARMRRFGYARELDALLADGTLLATPTMAVAGFLADGRAPGEDEESPPMHVYNTNPQNLAGHPAITLPAGVLPNGVPFGLQLTGPRFEDGRLLDLGEAWERAEPWPAAAPGYEPFAV